MQLEDHFDFLSLTDIRLKGRRIGIDTVPSYLRLNPRIDVSCAGEPSAPSTGTLDTTANT